MMFAKQYSHRLPADYDMGVIRERAARLGPLWDHAEGLLFKAFIAQERGQGPGVGNLYSSVYLWSDPLQAADFLLGERFQKVLDSFGQPHIESWLPLDVQRGPAQDALSLYREEWALAPGADRGQILAAEKARNQQLADSSDNFAVFLALDVQAWKDKAHKQNADFTWIKGDALNRGEVVAAARGCSVIVHAVNPPGYQRWAELVLPMIDNSIAAAVAEGATIVLPGTVYNFGPDAFARLEEDSPQHPLTRKGAIRVELEQRLLEATRQGARALIVRAGDFFGAKAGSSWFSQGLVKPAKPVASVSYPGAPGVGHQWAYLPDVARTMVELIARRDSLDAFARFHMAGHIDADGRQMSQAIQRVVSRRTGQQPSVRAFPWWLLKLAAPFVTTFREMQEMRYLWQTEVRMDNRRLVQILGSEPHTPLDEAVEATLVGIGCLPKRA